MEQSIGVGFYGFYIDQLHIISLCIFKGVEWAPGTPANALVYHWRHQYLFRDFTE